MGGAAQALPWGDAARAHIGLGIKPQFLAPQGFVVVDGSAPVSLRYTSFEVHPEMAHTLSYQADGLPASAGVAQRLRDGTPIAVEPAAAAVNEVLWDLGDVPTGAYHVTNEYEEFDCILLELAPALVVVQRPGDPPPLGVMVTEPFEQSVLVDGAAPFELTAVGPAGVTVTVEAGDMVRDPGLPADALCQELVWAPRFEVLTDAPLERDEAAGPDRWRLEATWDTRQVPDGAYLLRVTVRAPSGEATVSYARRWFNVAHAPTHQPDVADGDEGGGVSRGEGCAGGSAGGAWLSLVTWLGLRRPGRRAA